jgi:hypothetical protein
MNWWVGVGLIVVWLILFLVHPSGWIHLLLIGGTTLLVVQTAAHRKTKDALKNRR